MRRSDGTIAWPSIETLSCLLLVIYTLIAPSVKPPHVQTFGKAAFVMTWPARSPVDVDLYVRAPGGTVCWFGNLNGGGAHLEHDDLATLDSGYKGANAERTIIRTLEAGEYVATARWYSGESAPVKVRVELWSLEGRDRLLYSRTVTLAAVNDERLAFRARFNAAGGLTGTSLLPASLASQAVVR